MGWPKGTPNTHSAEHRARLNASNAERTGEQHPLWRGEQASYATVHQWVRRHYAKTGTCEECDEERITQWSNIDHGYRRVREDWRELCIPCHRAHDKELRTASADALTNKGARP